MTRDSTVFLFMGSAAFVRGMRTHRSMRASAPAFVRVTSVYALAPARHITPDLTYPQVGSPERPLAAKMP